MLPLVPPKLNPGHGHQIIVDPSRGEETETPPGYSLMGLFTKINSASPTQSPSVGGNKTPTSALKPRIFTHINLQFNSFTLYIFTSPCFYHSSEKITNNISHNPHYVPILQIRPLVSRAQASLTPQPRPNHATRASQSKGPASPSRANMQMSAPISSLIPVRMSTVLLLHWHSCRTARRPSYTSNITLRYKA